MSDEQELPIVLLHGTSGKSDWSTAVEQLANQRPIIRPNYMEQAASQKSANAPAISDVADGFVATVKADGKHRVYLVSYFRGWCSPRFADVLLTSGQ